MNRSHVACVLACGLLVSGIAAAHGRYDPYERSYDDTTSAYVGLNIAQIRYKEEGLDSITPTGGYFRLGAQLSPYVAVEGRVGGGFNDDSTDGYAVRVDTLYAAYLKGSLPLAPGFSIYGLGGLGGVRLHRNFGDLRADDTGFSYGLGADFALGNGAGLNLEWSRLVSGTNFGYDYDTDLASLGVTFRF